MTIYTPAELKHRALDFAREHRTDSDEKSEGQTFWRDFFAVFGLSPQRIGAFEARAKTLQGTVGFIDFFWPGTLLVEHKSRDKDLEGALKQALDYCTSGGLKDSELPRFVVVCDFERFILVELATGERNEFLLDQLHERLHLFDFILGREKRVYRDEDPVNIKAAELMGALHDELKRVGYDGHPLEVFLVRLMFCFFADDTGIFQKDQFADYLEARSREDGGDMGRIIDEMFRILDASPEARQRNLPEDLAALPYVNGELFSERLDPPYFDPHLRTVLLECARFNWALVSPAIFGSLFQSVMDSKARRALGAHYTSEKNILKTIHGLFLDELEAEFERISERRTGAGDKEKLYRAVLERIAGMRLLDPACGCGNFLILAYRELRRMEIKLHKAIRALRGNTEQSLDVEWAHRGITIDHMYGIEIEEFPSQIARVALWIMDHLMNVELAAALGDYRPSIPLVTSPHIVHGNALRLDWKEVVPPEQLTYILGNPPFIGKHLMSDEQSEEMKLVFEGKVRTYGILDYVTAWYIKSSDLMLINPQISSAFVSTNSITQGEQPGALWPYLYQNSVRIFFAHRTFKWSNEAKGNAAVFCVIIGFSSSEVKDRAIFEYDDIHGDPIRKPSKTISPYLTSGPEFALQSRRKPLNGVPEILYGNKPVDDGNLIFEDKVELERYLELEPEGSAFIRPMVSAKEFFNSRLRYCFWLTNAQPVELRNLLHLRGKLEKVKAFREKSDKQPTREAAKRAHLFAEIRQPENNYILVPRHSSENRPFIPFGFFPSDVIVHDSCTAIPNATLFHFGILQSTMHMAWTRQVCGRLKSDYRYSNTLVYNNYPWPKGFTGGEETPEVSKLKAKVEAAAQRVLDARAFYPDNSLADLYDPFSMPPDLVKAHRDLDAAVDKCYRKELFTTELERVEYLFGLYEEYTAGLFDEGRERKKRRKAT